MVRTIPLIGSHENYFPIPLCRASVAQNKPFPYFVPTEKDVIHTDFVYVLENEENQLKILRHMVV
jgi:hypothetical protein